MRLVKISAVKNHTLLATVNQTWPILCPPPNLDKVLFRKRAQKCGFSFTLKISEVKAVGSFRGPNKQTNKQIWVKYGITGLHTVLVIICEFHADRHRESRAVMWT
jgi:hypothetical protein